MSFYNQMLAFFVNENTSSYSVEEIILYNQIMVLLDEKKEQTNLKDINTIISKDKICQNGLQFRLQKYLNE